MKKKLNLIGALTSKPYAFSARSWELKSVETIDILDSISPNIKVNLRGSKILRILPSVNEFRNEEWISDRTRFAFDGLYQWRFTTPLIKLNYFEKNGLSDLMTEAFINKNKKTLKDSFFVPLSWQTAIKVLKDNINEKKDLIGIAGNHTDIQTLVTKKEFFNSQGSSNIILKSNAPKNCFDFNENYLYNNKIKIRKEKEINYLVLGSNLRMESPLISFQFRKMQKNNLKSKVFNIGPNDKSIFDQIHISNNAIDLIKLLEGKSLFSKLIGLKNKKLNLKILIGESFRSRQDYNSIFSVLNSTKILDTNQVSNVFKNVGEINSNVLGFASNIRKQKYINKQKNSVFFFTETDNLFDVKTDKSNFYVYLGFSNDNIYKNCHLILPTTNFFEKKGLYVNILGETICTKFIKSPLHTIRDAWKIYSLLSNKSYTKLLDLEHKINLIGLNENNKILNFPVQSTVGHLAKIYNYPIKNNISSFYNSDTIDRLSKNMKNCEKYFSKSKNNFY